MALDSVNRWIESKYKTDLTLHHFTRRLINFERIKLLMAYHRKKKENKPNKPNIKEIKKEEEEKLNKFHGYCL